MKACTPIQYIQVIVISIIGSTIHLCKMVLSVYHTSQIWFFCWT